MCAMLIEDEHMLLELLEKTHNNKLSKQEECDWVCI
jgi:hypothetical protein